MVTAPIPANEPQRLRTLRMYRILDTASEQSFDDLAHLAAAICDVPMCSITLVDEDRQWFKAGLGLGGSETPRDVSFCAHAILGDDLLIVPDATADVRFATNPFVTGDPRICFYAGTPLTVANGDRLGTLCVIDRKPRTLTTSQTEALRVLGRAVVTQLELRRALQDWNAVEQLLPMCAWCRQIRDDDGSWSSLEEFVSRAATITHGICPVCAHDFESGGYAKARV